MPPQELSRGEKMILAFDRPEPGHGNIPLATPFVVLLGMGGAFGTYEAVKEFGFPAHEDYEQVQDQINKLEQQASDLEDVADTLHEYDLTGIASQVDHLAEQAVVEVPELGDRLPKNYNPHVEGAVSGVSALVVGAIIIAGSLTAIRERASSIRANKPPRRPLPDPEDD